MQREMRSGIVLLMACAMLLCTSTTDARSGPVREHLPVVLMYHLVEEPPYSENEELFVPPEEFEAQVRALAEAGYTFLFADEYGPADTPCVVLTFDDGYADNFTTVLPILQKYGARATVFVAVSLLGREHYLTQAQVRALSDSGAVRIGSHTMRHVKLRGGTDAAAVAELCDSRAALEAITGQPVRALAYPNGSHSARSARLADEIYDFAYTIRSPRLATRFSPVEIPRVTVRRGMDASAVLAQVRAAERLLARLETD